MSFIARAVVRRIAADEARLEAYTDADLALVAGEDHPTRAVVVIMSEYVGMGDGELIYADGGYGPTHTPDLLELRDMTPDKWDVDDGLTSVDLLARMLLEDVPVTLEPDCSPGVPSWWQGRDNGDAGEEWSAHVVGPWTPVELLEVARRVNPYLARAC